MKLNDFGKAYSRREELLGFMGWFDKRTWQLKRKIKDLQADLIEAEEQGKFVVEQGLFFAELQDMGEMTMMVFGATNELASSEEGIIRSFFERNGFQVETVKLDRASTGLADCEVIPPEEFTRHVGRALKAYGWRLVDDSEEEKPADLEKKIYPLSALIRSISILFAEQVRQVIVTSKIKNNKEGNRLIHWMPKMVEALERKCPRNVVTVCQEFFEDAYTTFYGSVISRRESSSKLGTVAPAAPDQAKIPGLSFAPGFTPPQQRVPTQMPPVPPAAPPRPSPPPPTPVPPALPTAVPNLGAPTFRPGLPPNPAISTPPAEQGPDVINLPFTVRPMDLPPVPPAPPVRPGSSPAPVRPGSAPAPMRSAGDPTIEIERLRRTISALETVVKMHKELIGANPSRCVKNSEMLLEHVNQLFDASATCIMKKVPGTSNLTIHAQAGQKLAWGDGGGDGFPISSSTVSDCLRTRKLATKEAAGGSDDPTSSMVMHHIETTAAMPLIFDGEIEAVLYLDRRGGMRPFSEPEHDAIARIAKVFEDFPEQTLGIMA